MSKPDFYSKYKERKAAVKSLLVKYGRKDDDVGAWANSTLNLGEIEDMLKEKLTWKDEEVKSK